MPAVIVGFRTLALSSSVSLAIVAVEVLRRLISSDGRERFAVGVGLAPIAPLQVADAGSRGGGISPCFGGCDPASLGNSGAFRAGGCCTAWDAALDGARRQPLKLSLRRSEEPEESRVPSTPSPKYPSSVKDATQQVSCFAFLRPWRQCNIPHLVVTAGV
jgi:hypothetical protein